MTFRPVLALCAALLWTLASAPANANIMLGQTRVVFHGNDRDQSLQLMNVSSEPMLTEIWLDDGNSNAGPGQTDVPFVVTPPMARIEPRQAQTVRIMYTGEALPSDRESVFWLNVLEVPPKAPTAKHANRLEISIRSRIKLIYRPKALHGNPRAVMAALTWRLVAAGRAPRVAVRNPTPYNMAVANLQAVEGGRAVGTPVNVDVPPFSSKTVVLSVASSASLTSAKAPTGVHYAIVDDQGAYVPATRRFGQ